MANKEVKTSSRAQVKQDAQVVAGLDAALMAPAPAPLPVAALQPADQDWLNETQQAWDEQREREQLEAMDARAGERVLQLQPVDAGFADVAQTGLIAQASDKKDDDRKGAVVKEEEDDDRGGWFDWESLIKGAGALLLLAGLANRNSDSNDPADPPPPPPPPGRHLLVYTNEDDSLTSGGVRVESGDTDDNTQSGSYQLVRLETFSAGDEAYLNASGSAGSGGMLYVEFDEDRADLSIELLATQTESLVSAEISTDSAFCGDVLVSTEGESSDAYFYFEHASADQVLVSIDANLEATGDSSDLIAYMDFTGESDDVFASVDATVLVDAQSAGAYLSLEVSSDTNDDAVLSGDMTLELGSNANTSSADMAVSVFATGSSGSADLNGNLSVHALAGAGNAYSSADLDVLVVGGSGAVYSGDIDIVADRRYTELGLTLSVDTYSGPAVLGGDLNMEANKIYSSTSGLIQMSGETVYLWGDYVSDEVSDDDAGTTTYTDANTAGQWSVFAGAEYAESVLTVDLSGDSLVQVSLDLSVQADHSYALSTVDVYVSAYSSGGGVIWDGGSVDVITVTDFSDDQMMLQGEDAAGSVLASDLSNAATANNADSHLNINVSAGSGFDGAINLDNHALGTNAEAVLDLYVTASQEAWINGGLEYHGNYSQSTDLDTSTDYAQLSSGEDAYAADWHQEAAGAGADACMDVTVLGTQYLDARFGANIDADASADGSSYVNVLIAADEGGSNVNSVFVSGDFAVDFSASSVYYSSEDMNNLEGEDSHVALSFSVDAVDWAAHAQDGGESHVHVYLEASDDSVLLANLSAEAGDDSYSHVSVNMSGGENSFVGGGLYAGEDATLASGISDVYIENTAVWTSTDVLTAADWQATANGEGGGAEVDVYLDFNGDTGAASAGFGSLDVSGTVAVNIGAEASATDSYAAIDVAVYATDSVYFNGGIAMEATSTEADNSDEADLWAFDATTTWTAANWEVVASGESASADAGLYVNTSMDVELLVNQQVSATGLNSYAHASFDIGGEDGVSGLYVGGNWVETSSCIDTNFDGTWDVTDYTQSGQNAVWNVLAAGDQSTASLDLDVDATQGTSGWVEMDLSLSAAATGVDSYSYVSGFVITTGNINVGAWDLDEGDELWGASGSTLSATATGAGSYTSMDMVLVGESVDFGGHINVVANGADGIDADAVMSLYMYGSDDANVCADIQVLALGDDNDASLVLTVSGGSENMDAGGTYQVQAVGGVASMSLYVGGSSGSAGAFISLDADEGGIVNFTLSADVYEGDDIEVRTDNDGVVNLSLDVNYYDDEDIDVFGGEGGVFNLFLKDGQIGSYDVSGDFWDGGLDVNLDRDVQGYGGQFNLVVENPANLMSTEVGSGLEVVGSFLVVDGFNATGLELDTISFQGEAFDGYYVNGTDSGDFFANFDDIVSAGNAALDGNVDYFFGSDGTNGYLLVDGEGDGIDYVIELTGVTNIDWDAIRTTAGEYIAP